MACRCSTGISERSTLQHGRGNIPTLLVSLFGHAFLVGDWYAAAHGLRLRRAGGDLRAAIIHCYWRRTRIYLVVLAIRQDAAGTRHSSARRRNGFWPP